MIPDKAPGPLRAAIVAYMILVPMAPEEPHGVQEMPQRAPGARRAAASAYALIVPMAPEEPRVVQECPVRAPGPRRAANRAYFIGQMPQIGGLMPTEEKFSILPKRVYPPRRAANRAYETGTQIVGNFTVAPAPDPDPEITLLLTLTDSTATFPSDGVVNSYVVLVAGRGKGQRRRIVEVDGTDLRLDYPWLITPDTTTVYQIGGIQWRWRCGWFRFLNDEEDNVRGFGVTYQPLDAEQTMDVRVFHDHNTEDAVTWGADYSSNDNVGIEVESEGTDLVTDLTKALGYAEQRLDNRREPYIDGPRQVAVELSGVSNEEQARVYELDLWGVAQ